MSNWVTQVEAAALLGVHRSVIPKMLRRGDLVARSGRRPSLLREDVLALADARAASAAEAERRRDQKYKRPRPPDAEHEWLPIGPAAAVMGCSTVALGARARRQQVPSTLSDGRRWFRLDLLELQLRAKDAGVRRKRERRVGARPYVAVMASKQQQVADVVEGMGLGLVAMGVDRVTTFKIDLEFAFSYAWRRWPHAQDYPSIGRAVKPDNEFWIGVNRSQRRRGAYVRWINEGGEYSLSLPADWTPDETAEVLSDRPLHEWVDLAEPFVQRLSRNDA